ncbi:MULTISPECIES: hypothetical protein [Sulfolobaceae]|uniref:hypothetical protein n=1 Tax=Sulfolobaceae TaxID=118883 RepID=UPI001E4EA3BE|nr:MULTISPECIES: hypothetical protein [unclassified Sulfolobus]
MKEVAYRYLRCSKCCYENDRDVIATMNLYSPLGLPIYERCKHELMMGALHGGKEVSSSS